MDQQSKTRLKRTGALAFIALLIGASIGFVQLREQNNATVISKGTTAMPGVAIGGPFTLINQNGEMVTEKDFTGYKLMYFGFTMCPMICPMGLQKIAKTLNALGDEGKTITPILITVDPERDTPPVMKEYVKQFHPQMVGLTGNKDQIDKVVKEYRVFAAKVNDEELTDYTMDHSSFTYLMSPANRLLALYRDSDTADFMAEDIKKKIAGDS